MKSPIDLKDMTNDEFMSHLMTGYSKHGALVQMVVMDCLQHGLDHYISHKKEILAEHDKGRDDRRISLINMKAWVECCEETKQLIEEKYSTDDE
tara:strand:+ start:2351 stop:2632 length:282 start_codon:yes stop_codon:yes gene_type:complete